METKGNKEKCTLRFCDTESLNVAQEIIKHIYEDGPIEVQTSGNDIVLIGTISDINLALDEISLQVIPAPMLIL